MCIAYDMDSLHATVEVGQDDDRLVDYAIDLLGKVKKKPFFLAVLNISSHTPFKNGFGRSLKDKGIWDEALVVIASDHHLGLWMENNKREKIPFIITGGFRSRMLSERVRSNDPIYQSHICIS